MVLPCFREKFKATIKIQSLAFELTKVLDMIRDLPANMRMFAYRIEPSGGSIAAISSNCSKLSEELSTYVSTVLEDKNSALRSAWRIINEV